MGAVALHQPALDASGRWNASGGCAAIVQAKLWLQDAIAGMPKFPDDAKVDEELDRKSMPPPHRRTHRDQAGGRLSVRYFYDTEFIDNGAPSS